MNEAESIEKFCAKARADCNNFSATPGEIEGGRWIRISGLQSTAGQKLNGKVGQILNNEANREGRFQIKIDGEANKGNLIKEINLTDIPKEDLVKTYRIPAAGEVGTRHKVLLFPKHHSMFTKCGHPSGNAPAMALCGLPLMVQKINPYVQLHEQADRDNQWATWLVIDPHSGFAPLEWQMNVGPVLVYRPGGLDFSSDDMSVTNEFLSTVLDRFGDGMGFDPMTLFNEDFFQRFVRKRQRDSKLSKMGSSLNHLNILS